MIRMRTTPGQLWALLALVGVCAALLFAALSTGVSDARQGVKTVGSDSVPSIDDALAIYAALSDMDAQVANYLLLTEHPPANAAALKATVQSAYETDRKSATNKLLAAAQNITYGDKERVPIRTMLDGVQRYEAGALQAELLIDRGDRIGALAAYRGATDLMHDPHHGLLKAAVDLEVANHDALTGGYSALRANAGRDVALIWLAGLALLLALIGFQVLLAWRMRRALNPPMAVATVLTLVLVIGGASSIGAVQAHLKVAKQDAYDSVFALSQAKAIATDANADESRYIIDPERAQSYQAAFLEKSLIVAGFKAPGTTISTYDATLAESLSAIHSGHGSALAGYIGAGLGNITFQGESDAALKTLDAWAKYQVDDRKLRNLIVSGNMTEGVRFDISSAPQDSNGAFYAFTGALDTWIKINRDAFNGAVARGGNDISNWQLYAPVGLLVVFALTFVGLRPRLGEYA